MRFTKQNIERIFDKFMQGGDSLADLKGQILNLADIPEKVVVPKFVAEFYEKCEDAPLSFLITQLEATYSCSELGEWYRSCRGRHRNGRANAQEVIAKMKLYGYEVEKEPLYHVKFPNITNCGFSMFLFKDFNGKIEIADNANHERMRFTEAEIKSIDERYWPFAVPVDGANKD